MFSIHSSVILAHCVRLQVSTTMLPLMLLSFMLLLIAHIRLGLRVCALSLPRKHYFDALSPIPRAMIPCMVSSTTTAWWRPRTSSPSGARPRQPCRQSHILACHSCTAQYERSAAQYGCHAQCGKVLPVRARDLSSARLVSSSTT